MTDLRIETTVTRMLEEIRADMAIGIVPNTVKSFGELHDYVDANEYGGFCTDELYDALHEHFDDPYRVTDYLNAAQSMVDVALRYNVLGVR